MFAIATAMMLESTRVFVSYLVFTIDQSQRVTIGLVAVTVFAFPAACWLLVRLTPHNRLIAASVLILTGSRLLMQIIEQPMARLALSGLTIIAWGMLTVLLVGANRRPVAAGLVLGFGLDLAFRSLRGSLDLPWIPGPFQTAQVFVALVLLTGIWWLRRDAIEGAGTTWRSAGALIIIGPAIAIFHLLTGNIGFVSINAELSATASSALLAAGMALGIVIAILRLLAINMIGAGGGPLIGRFILFDAIIGAIALVFAWGSDGMTLLGVLFATVTVTELVLFALTAEPSRPSGGIGPAAVMTTMGLLLQFTMLFVYYTSSGSGLMLGFAWIGLVVGTLFSALSLTASVQREPLNLRAYLAPAAFVGVFLTAAVLTSAANPVSPDPVPGDADEITVITYNIQSGFSRGNYWDLERTAEVIEDSGADIVILQEVDRGWIVTSGNDQLRWLSERLGMPYAWGPASNDNLWGNAVLSRFPIASETTTKYESTQNLRRSALSVRLELGDGRAVNIVATHLDNPSGASEARTEQVDQLLDVLDTDQPTILAGDFNMAPDNPLIQQVVSSGMTDTAAAMGVDDGTSEDDRRIDYVFVTSEISIEEARVVETDASDHKPVVVKVRLPNR